MGCLVLLSCLGTPAVQAADPLKSDACQQAMDTLRDVEAALATAAASAPAGSSPQRQNREKLGALKQRAASICLRSRADTPAPAASRLSAAPGGREALPAVAPTRALPAPASPPPGRSATPPQATPPPVLSLVSCDAAGCWASDGTRLQRSGGLLLGPRGYCSATGSVLNCP